jgi:hypothetical protein
VKEREYRLRDRTRFEFSQQLVREVFDIEGRLPEQVFNKDDLMFGVWDFAEMPCVDFIKLIAGKCGDSSIFITSLDPAPEAFYETTGGQFSVAEIAVASVESDFWPVMGYSTSETIDSFIAATHILCLVGSSSLWGCWAEYQHGMAIVGYPKWVEPLPTFNPPMASVNEALELFAELMHFDWVSAEFDSPFVAAYGGDPKN